MTLETESDIEVTGEAAEGVKVVSAVRRLHLDVVLMNIHMPVIDREKNRQNFPIRDLGRIEAHLNRLSVAVC